MSERFGVDRDIIIKEDPDDSNYLEVSTGSVYDSEWFELLNKADATRLRDYLTNWIEKS